MSITKKIGILKPEVNSDVVELIEKLGTAKVVVLGKAEDKLVVATQKEITTFDDSDSFRAIGIPEEAVTITDEEFTLTGDIINHVDEMLAAVQKRTNDDDDEECIFCSLGLHELYKDDKEGIRKALNAVFRFSLLPEEKRDEITHKLKTAALEENVPGLGKLYDAFSKKAAESNTKH